jgi:hypothetical protein
MMCLHAAQPQLRQVRLHHRLHQCHRLLGGGARGVPRLLLLPGWGTCRQEKHKGVWDLGKDTAIRSQQQYRCCMEEGDHCCAKQRG